jgi:hypothetical protein
MKPKMFFTSLLRPNADKNQGCQELCSSIHSLHSIKIIHLSRIHRLFELGHKVLVELDQSVCPLGTRREEGGSEMQCTFLLSKATARNDTYTRRVKHAEAVEFIWFATLGLGLFDCLLG